MTDSDEGVKQKQKTPSPAKVMPSGQVLVDWDAWGPTTEVPDMEHSHPVKVVACLIPYLMGHANISENDVKVVKEATKKLVEGINGLLA